MSSECSLLALDYCVAKGTKVLTANGVVPIEWIKPGMYVLSCTDGTKLSMNRVTRSACIGVMDAFDVVTMDGRHAVCTLDHTWMRYDGVMAETGALCAGDRLAHVKDGFSGRYPTWYIRSHCNYVKKHKIVCEALKGEVPGGCNVDHRDGDHLHWHVHNLRYLDEGVNKAQGGRRYWKAVKSGERDDSKRLIALRKGLKGRRSYAGKGNPNYGKWAGEERVCPICGDAFYTYPSQLKKYCKFSCYRASRVSNYKIRAVVPAGCREMHQITVENAHNYVLENGMVSGNSQIELRVAADESQDPTMLDIFRNDGDMHLTTACSMFGLEPEEVDGKKHRRPAKTTNFGTIYLISAKGLWQQFQHEGLTEFTERDCHHFLDSWRQTYPGFFDWVEEIKAEARRTGMVRDMFGRIRWIPELQSSLRYVREAGIRQAVNAPIQSGAGGILKEAMRRLRPCVKEWQDDSVVCRPLLQVHDELIFEVEDEYLPAIAPQFHEVMVRAVELSVPVKVDVETGKNWRDLEEYELT